MGNLASINDQMDYHFGGHAISFNNEPNGTVKIRNNNSITIFRNITKIDPWLSARISAKYYYMKTYNDAITDK